MDALFILHADHEQNCSTAALRVVASSQVDPYSACAAACAALYGPLHGGANEAVIRMLSEIGCLENVPAFIRSVKEGHGRLQGFGHRVYKNYDPRAKIIRDIAYDVFDVTGKNPLLDIALGLEEVALADEYFISRKLYPNVDFIRLIYQAMDSRSRCSRCCSRFARCRVGGALGRDARAQHEDRATKAALCRTPAPRLRADVVPVGKTTRPARPAGAAFLQVILICLRGPAYPGFSGPLACDLEHGDGSGRRNVERSRWNRAVGSRASNRIVDAVSGARPPSLGSDHERDRPVSEREVDTGSDLTSSETTVQTPDAPTP